MKFRWQISLRSLLLLLVALTVTGVIGRRMYLRFYPAEVTALCAFDDRDIISGWHLKRMLEREGIYHKYHHSSNLPNWPNGTYVVCEIDATAHDRVLKLLEAAAKASLPTVVLTEDNYRAGLWLHGDYRDPFEQTYDRTIGDILKNDPPSEFTRILRAIAESDASVLSDDERVIHRLSGLRRWMLQPDGKLAAAFEASVEFPAERETPTARELIARVVKFYFYDDFREMSVDHLARLMRYPLPDEVVETERKQTEFAGRLEVALSDIGRATRAFLYGGLPHRVVDENNFLTAKKQYATAEFGSECFYSPALPLDAAQTEQLFDLCGDKKAYRESKEEMLCGGFHPDYAVEFLDSAGVSRVLICFGCQEVRILGPAGQLDVDLTEEAAEKWKPILEEIGKKLPPPSPRE